MVAKRKTHAPDAGAPIPPPVVLRLAPAVELSDAQLRKLCALNSELRIERTREGDLVIMPPTHPDSGRQNAELTRQIGNWAEEDGAGVTFDSSTGFTLPNRAMRSPDASWILRSRWEALPLVERRRRFALICPDFVAELRSSSDRLQDVQAKMQEYIENGARLGWLIDPQQRTLYVYRPGLPVKRLSNPRTVCGDPVLPGFVLDLERLWGS